MRRAEGRMYCVASNKDIPQELVDGTADFALLGSDKFNELAPDSGLRFEALSSLACRFALFVPETKTWDKDQELTVATSNPRTFAAFVAQTGILATCTRVVNGKVERSPASGLTDAGFDIVETGTSLRANNLRIIQEGQRIELGGAWKGMSDGDNEASRQEAYRLLEQSMLSYPDYANIPVEPINELLVLIPDDQNLRALQIGDKEWALH